MKEDSYTKTELKSILEFHDKQMIDKVTNFFENNLDDYFEDYLLRKYDIKPDQLISALKKIFPESFI